MARRFKWLRISRANLILLTVSLLIAFVIGELVFRWMLFSDSDAFQNMRRPELYASIQHDDYWKLYYEFGGEYKPPTHPHPLLGWVYMFDGNSYMHHEMEHVRGRRPVLLYGDSFAACVEESECFQDLLNRDSAFARENYLLNYGVGGYGVGQSALLCQTTAPRYEKPLVVFSTLTTDIDRTILSVRTGQKPYFDVADGELQLKGYPIEPNPADFFEHNPPEITSYLYRRFLFSRFNFLPYRIRTWLNGKYQFIEKMKAVNGPLLKRVAADLRAAQIDFVFLIFHFEDDMMSPNSEDNWRDQFFKQVLAENDIPYIWSKGILREHRKQHPENSHDAYVIPGNGHPTTLYNQLIADEIKKIALQRAAPAELRRASDSRRYFETWLAAERYDMLQDSALVARMRANAEVQGKTFAAELEWRAVRRVRERMKANRASHGLRVFE